MRLELVDIAIVGAGFGGAAFAWRLSQQRPDLRIICVERGGFPDRSAMPALRPDWQRAVLNEWATSPNLRLKSGKKSPSADYPIDDTRSDFKPLMWNGVGGSTIAWAAHFPRLHPSDFRTRSLDGVGDDWPFTYTDLEPYYDLNDAECGVSGLAGDPAYPPKPERVMPPVALGRLGMAAARGFDALGWHWWPVDAAINSRPHAGRAGCNHCGPCLTGCVTGAKSSTDLTYWPKALANGVELRTHCVVQQVVIEAGHARGIRYRDASGHDVFQPARIVVVGGNGIGTPRLLLASGVESPALGKNLMFHGAAYARGLFAEELDGPVGPVGCAIYSHEFYETDERRGFKRGVHLQVARENALLLQATRLDIPWGGPAQQWLREEFRHSVAVLVCNEDLPEAHNRVTLADHVEADGLPGVKLEYRISEHTRRSLEFGLDRAEEMLRAAGAHRTVRIPLAPLTGWHLLGTARMGDDPRTSVADGSGRVHAVADLIVADGSLFPTVGAVNPGSTIGAVALKIADDLARCLA
ncbi:MAG: GMC family oxidoreductase [Hyphomicrobiales bacterium]|nr:GMC family oxidoreductase [Hyphomicrobiales bacterium]MBV9974871.1 GMC family oxidoreductase [Hyphomicrobiales bacterium]